jgi:hypothetical protein
VIPDGYPEGITAKQKGKKKKTEKNERHFEKRNAHWRKCLVSLWLFLLDFVHGVNLDLGFGHSD